MSPVAAVHREGDVREKEVARRAMGRRGVVPREELGGDDGGEPVCGGLWGRFNGGGGVQCPGHVRNECDQRDKIILSI